MFLHKNNILLKAKELERFKKNKKSKKSKFIY